jgi:hypothetical protein
VLTTAIASATSSTGWAGWLPFLTAIGGAALAYYQHQKATPAQAAV